MSIKKVINSSLTNILIQLTLAVLWFVLGILHVHRAEYTIAAIMLTCTIIEFGVVLANCIVSRIEHRLDEIEKELSK